MRTAPPPGCRSARSVGTTHGKNHEHKRARADKKTWIQFRKGGRQLSFQLRNKQWEEKHTKASARIRSTQKSPLYKVRKRARAYCDASSFSSFYSLTIVQTPRGLCYRGTYPRIGSNAEVFGLPSAMRPLPIINGKEERRETLGGRGRERERVWSGVVLVVEVGGLGEGRCGCLGNRSPFCNCAPLISWK